MGRLSRLFLSEGDIVVGDKSEDIPERRPDSTRIYKSQLKFTKSLQLSNNSTTMGLESLKGNPYKFCYFKNKGGE